MIFKKRPLHKLFEAAAAGAALATFLSLAVMEAGMRFPSLYSDSIEDWFQRHNLPQTALEPFKNRNIRVYKLDPLGDAASFVNRTREKLRHDQARMPDGPLRNIFGALVYASIPLDAAKAAWNACFGQSNDYAHTNEETRVGDMFFLSLKPEQLSENAWFDELSRRQKEAINYYVIMHELRHTQQKLPETAADALSNEADADIFGLEQEQSIYPDTPIAKIIEAARAVKVIGIPERPDLIHATARFIEAWRYNEKMPDPVSVLDNTAKTAALWARFTVAQIMDEWKKGKIAPDAFANILAAMTGAVYLKKIEHADSMERFFTPVPGPSP